jgi:RHS repeat-associated protein
LFLKAQASTSVGTAFVWGDGAIPGWALLGEYDNGSSKGSGRTEYIWLPTEDGSAIPIGLYRNGRFFAIHTDHLGTPRLMTDDANKPVWQWPYSAFGTTKPTGILKATPNPKAAMTNRPMLLKATAPQELNLGFPGWYRDPEMGEGVFYNGQRDAVSAGTGRFFQVDPVRLLGGLNLFTYADASALNGTDPDGLTRRSTGNPRASLPVSESRPGGFSRGQFYPGIGPNAAEVVGPYSTVTQGTQMFINNRGRMSSGEGNAFARFLQGSQGDYVARSDSGEKTRLVSHLPNGTTLQYREGRKGPRIDITPPGGMPETVHFPLTGSCRR